MRRHGGEWASRMYDFYKTYSIVPGFKKRFELVLKDMVFDSLALEGRD